MADHEEKDEERKSKGSLRDRREKSASFVRAPMGQKSLSRLKVRKPSYGFSSVHGIRPVDRGSQVGMEQKRPLPTYLPTYQLESRLPFKIADVEKVVEASLDEHFAEHVYNVQESPALALRMAGVIMRVVKSLGFNRYRCICVVTIRQKRAQSYNNAVAFLWDHTRDRYVNVTRDHTTAFVQVTVFGVYLD